jgi:hypothetical protein
METKTIPARIKYGSSLFQRETMAFSFKINRFVPLCKRGTKGGFWFYPTPDSSLRSRMTNALFLAILLNRVSQKLRQVLVYLFRKFCFPLSQREIQGVFSHPPKYHFIDYMWYH